MSTNNFPFPQPAGWGIFLRLTGIHPSIYERASPSFQRQLRMIGMGMLFTACFSGALLALSTYYYAESWIYALIAFGLAALFTLLLDRKLVTATVPLGVSGRLIRLLLVAAWIIIHTTMIETVLFTEDLQADLKEEQISQVEHIHDQYAQATAAAEAQRAEVNAAIAASEAVIREAYDKELAEVSGEGVTQQYGVGDMTRYLKAMTERREAQEKEGIKLYSEALLTIENNLAEARRLRDAQLAELPTIQEEGPLKRAERLHKILWGAGNFSLKAVAFAFLLIITAVELLPLIGKGLADFEEYYTLHSHDKMAVLASDKMKARIQQEIDAVEMAHRAHYEKAKIRLGYHRQTLELRLNEILACYRQTVNGILLLEDEMNNAHQQSTQRVEQHVQAAGQQALEALSVLFEEKDAPNYSTKSTVP